MSANNWNWSGPPDAASLLLNQCRDKKNARAYMNLCLKLITAGRGFLEAGSVSGGNDPDELSLELAGVYGCSGSHDQVYLHRIRETLFDFYAPQEFYIQELNSSGSFVLTGEKCHGPNAELAIIRVWAESEYSEEEQKVKGSVDSEDAYWRHYEQQYGHLAEDDGPWVRIQNLRVRKDGTSTL